ncbi:MAG: hypothetical protein M3501_12360 [Actinomycetota bacterium]|nr:hypothetical protein [Actinomycetota bacterium]
MTARIATRRRVGSLVIVATAVCSACAGDDEPSASSGVAVTTTPDTTTASGGTASSTTTPTAPTTTQTTQTTQTSPPTATDPATSTTAPAPSTTAPALPTTAPDTTSPVTGTTLPATSGPPPDTAPPTTIDPRQRAADALVASLPVAGEIDLAADWSVRDLQADANEGSVPPSELDPFRNVVSCPPALIDLTAGGAWAERKFNGVDPSPEGVLIVRVQLVAEGDRAWAARRDGVAECEPASVDAFADRAGVEISVDGAAVDVERLAVFSSSTADAPFPSQVVFVAAHRDGVTAIVAYFGLNEADEFDDAALGVLTTVLADATR